MEIPPLQPLHLNSVLSQAKLNHYARLTTEALICSLEPGQVGSLKTRPDGTVIDGHHRIAVLRERGIDVDVLPREVLTKARSIMKPSIYWIPGPWIGKLAILARPRGDDWLADEVEGWRSAGVQVVVSLLSDDESRELGLEDERLLVDRGGLRFISFPINDYDVPSSNDAVRQVVRELEELLDKGCVVGIHCRAGVGRSALVAACLLVNNGEDSEASFEKISAARGVAVPDTLAQRQWVGEFARLSHSSGR